MKNVMKNVNGKLPEVLVAILTNLQSRLNFVLENNLISGTVINPLIQNSATVSLSIKMLPSLTVPATTFDPVTN